jgi:sporulation protein YlmC with PRC-barrel domain
MMREDQFAAEGDPGGASRLRPLGELPALALDRESPDVCGWSVATAAGERIGTVKDLLVDPDRLSAEYLLVDPDRESMAGLPPTELAAIPLTTTRIDLASRQVVVSNAPVVPPPIRLRYQSTTHLTWIAAAIGVAAVLLAWLLGMFGT